MNLLAIDTSTQNLSFAVRHKNKTVLVFNRQMRFGSSTLIARIERSLKRLALDIRQFDAFAIGAGPGSFTGLRVGFSITKAFTIACSRPALAISSFYTLAYPFRLAHPRLAVISDAKKNLVYAATFKTVDRRFVCEDKPKLATLERVVREKKDHFFLTPDAHLLAPALAIAPQLGVHPEAVYPNAKYLLELAVVRYNTAEFTSLEKLEPLYIHPKTCQIR